MSPGSHFPMASEQGTAHLVAREASLSCTAVGQNSALGVPGLTHGVPETLGRVPLLTLPSSHHPCVPETFCSALPLKTTVARKAPYFQASRRSEEVSLQGPQTQALFLQGD